jgi:Tfp pilus assembly protein PilF
MRLIALIVLTMSITLLPATAIGQDDETRQGLGLPTMIGENTRAGDRMNISGRVSVESVEKLKQPPVVTIIVSVAGAVADRAIANSSGYYLVRSVPRGNVTLIIEVNGTEVARKPIQSPPMGNPRYDFSIPWPAAASGISKPGVIDLNQSFVRTGGNETLFQRAVSATKGNDTSNAITLFNQLLTAEPKDFVAWTELGTLYFKGSALDNAEACYFKAIELKRDYFIALLNLGKLYFSKKQYDNAVLALSNAVKANPASADAHHFLGESYLQVKKGTSAAYHFNEALRIAPQEKSELHLRLASLYDAAKMRDKAAAEYKSFLAKNPDYTEKAQLQKYITENQK